MSNQQYAVRGERRQQGRWDDRAGEAGFRLRDRSEIITQFFTRYLFFALALIYFSTLDGLGPVLFDISQLLMMLGVYFVLNSWFFHLALKGVSLLKIRSAMAADLVIVTLSVIHDPNAIPPSALAFLMVPLGNGMRYGMGVFAEVLGGVFFGMALSFAVRYRLGGFDITAGDVFFGVFWVTLALCVHILMGRIRGTAPPAQPPRPAGGGRLHLYRCKSQQTDAEGAVAYYGTLIDEPKTA